MGATVFAGCLQADGPGATELKNVGSHRLHVLQLDVTDETQVAECAQYVDKILKGSGEAVVHAIGMCVCMHVFK
jgi:enoyl-[acyl-carrier-protein] reductase (NADH)